MKHTNIEQQLARIGAELARAGRVIRELSEARASTPRKGIEAHTYRLSDGSIRILTAVHDLGDVVPAERLPALMEKAGLGRIGPLFTHKVGALKWVTVQGRRMAALTKGGLERVRIYNRAS